MGADKSAENTPNAPRFIYLSPKFGILMKKGFFGSSWDITQACALQQKIIFAFNTIISRHRNINVIKCM
jgi:hypothetical protein